MQDKLLHFAFSGAMLAALAGGLHWHGVPKKTALAAGLVVSLSIGAGKELIVDQQADGRDMLANSAGVAVATVALTIPLNRAPKIKKNKLKK